MSRYLVVIGVALGCAFAAGRWTAPKSVTQKAQAQAVERETVAQAAHVETVVTETQKPDGSKESVTRTVSDSHSQVSDQIASSQSESREVVAKGARLHIRPLAGVSFSGLSQFRAVYGADINLEIFGPASVGAIGLSSGMGLVYVGINL